MLTRKQYELLMFIHERVREALECLMFIFQIQQTWRGHILDQGISVADKNGYLEKYRRCIQLPEAAWTPFFC